MHPDDLAQLILDPIRQCDRPPTGCRRCATPLSGRRRTWCSDECRDWYYIHHRWTDAREEAMRRANRVCQQCDRPATEVDHIAPRYGMPLHIHSCLHHQHNLRALCHDCHVNRRLWDGF